MRTDNYLIHACGSYKKLPCISQSYSCSVYAIICMQKIASVLTLLLYISLYITHFGTGQNFW